MPRMDVFLFDTHPDYSRAYFKTLITDGYVTVNGTVNKKSSYKVKPDDTVDVEFPAIKQYDLTPQKVDFEIIDIQANFIIINKPSGLIVHPSKKDNTTEITLVHGLLYEFSELKQFDGTERPGIVHRLDKGTSGLMIIARNIKAQIAISARFKKREIKKEYLAVVKGHPPKKGKIDCPIGRHPNKTHMMSHVGFNSKPAITYYEVLEQYKNCSLVSVKIITGRTHQIRVHFASIGHGLLGDDMYGIQSKHIQRPALHAHALEFEFGRENFIYKLDPPKDFNALLETIEK